MDKLIVKLEIVKAITKEIHYDSFGLSFYGVHLLMDKIGEDIDTFIDDINEICFLGSNMKPPSKKRIYQEVSEELPHEVDLRNLKVALIGVLDQIDNIGKGHSEVMFVNDAGVDDLLGRISSNIKKSLGLVNRTLATD